MARMRDPFSATAGEPPDRIDSPFSPFHTPRHRLVVQGLDCVRRYLLPADRLDTSRTER